MAARRKKSQGSLDYIVDGEVQKTGYSVDEGRVFIDEGLDQRFVKGVRIDALLIAAKTKPDRTFQLGNIELVLASVIREFESLTESKQEEQDDVVEGEVEDADHLQSS